GEGAAVGVLRQPRRTVGQHVGQGALAVDGRDRLGAVVTTGFAHPRDEQADPAGPVLDRVGGVVGRAGLVVGEEAADRGVPYPVDVLPLAVLADGAATPHPNVRFGADGTGRHLDGHRDDVGGGVGIHSGP